MIRIMANFNLTILLCVTLTDTEDDGDEGDFDTFAGIEEMSTPNTHKEKENKRHKGRREGLPGALKLMCQIS